MHLHPPLSRIIQLSLSMLFTKEVSHFLIPKITKSEDCQHQLHWAQSQPSQDNIGPGLGSRMSVQAYDSLMVNFSPGLHVFFLKHISAIFLFFFKFFCFFTLLLVLLLHACWYAEQCSSFLLECSLLFTIFICVLQIA